MESEHSPVLHPNCGTVCPLLSDSIMQRKLLRKTWRCTCSQKIRFAQTVHQWLFCFVFWKHNEHAVAAWIYPRSTNCHHHHRYHYHHHWVLAPYSTSLLGLRSPLVHPEVTLWIDRKLKPCAVDRMLKPCAADRKLKPSAVDRALKPCAVDRMLKPCAVDRTLKPCVVDRM